jgi:hypothetical protein
MLVKLFGEKEARAMQESIMTNSGKQGWLTWLSEALPLPVQNRSPEPVENFVWEDMSIIIEF